MAQLSARVLALYKKKLRSLPKVRYVFAFAMNSRDGLLNYHLVFASQNPKGLEKMKEAMRAVDQSGHIRSLMTLLGKLCCRLTTLLRNCGRCECIKRWLVVRTHTMSFMILR